MSYLRFRYEQLYVLISRITERSDLTLLVKNGDQSTLDYISDLSKDPFTSYYFSGFGKDLRTRPRMWSAKLAAKAAGFVV